ncbi:MAG TPA: glycosyltransferase family 2 protein [Candidatus Limnocylindrales bacterium]|jgi:cellulose synthase/poly-beta-1,6-N-acetylglucosamine synthase-like glycosyltransferase|nr:glycosyltransferase family 2 protein [Candidatus Limnocylindrales bacterium]
MIRTAIFWLAAAILAATYIGMPALTILRGRFLRRPHLSADIAPRVSVVIAAHNEVAVIGDRIENLLALDYPRDALEIVIASDGSTDGTDAVVAGYAGRGVRLVAPGRVGKGATLEAAVAASSHDILVFSDANSHYAPGALRALVRAFADPDVGGVAGNQVYLPKGATNADAIELGERGYWDFDRLLKRSQSAAGSVTSGTGAIYAIRREHFGPIPEGITDDMLDTMRVVDQGGRLVFAEDAMAFEPVAPSSELEFRRKVRIMTRSFRALILMRRLFDPRRTGWYAVQLFWHKVMLRTAAVPLLALAVISPTLWSRGPIYQLATVGQALCYGLAAAGIALVRRPIGRHPLVAVPAYFTMVNLASVRAILNLVRGERIDRWIPERIAGTARGNGSTMPAAALDESARQDDKSRGAAVA